MNLESKKVTVEKTASYLFEALCDVRNFEKLMPESIAKFEVTDAYSFIFGLRGMPEIKLQIMEKTPNSEIVLGAASEKLPFKFTATIDSLSDSSSEVQLLFEGEFNAMMAMMVKDPITKFIETLADNMHKL